MKKEDVEFLLKLKEDLKNGDHVYQASPRFWMILDYEQVNCSEDDAEDVVFYFPDTGETYDLNGAKKFLRDYYDLSNDDIEELENIEEEDYDSLVELCDYLSIPCYKNYVKEESFLSTKTGAFLTKEDADEFLKVNGYHFNEKAHSYALTGWRNPRYEELISILEDITKDDFYIAKEDNACN